MSKKIVETTNIQNQKIREILEKYNHYEHMNYADWKAFMDYHNSLEETDKDYEEIHHIKQYKIYNSTMVSLYTMHSILYSTWGKHNSGYNNNAFFDFQKLVKQVNCYFEIENPYKPANKIAYGWKFCMDKSDSYLDKSWKLYLWGCIKNYLIRNGVEFDKATSLKVRKIVGLVDIYDTAE